MPDSLEINTRRPSGDTLYLSATAGCVWDTDEMAWVKATASEAGAGLTDAELRATPVSVSGPLTDAQLRAVAVPVSGTFWQATQPVSGTFWQATQPVSGPLTDAQLRASALTVAPNLARKYYQFLLPSQVHVASANAVHWDLFNADATAVVRVVSIRQIPNITTAVTGIVFDWLLERTTAVGTGGSALTAWLADLDDTALDADITCRSKPTGGATASTDLRSYALSSEETNAATIQIAAQGGLELVPPALDLWAEGKGIVLRPNQGMRCVQVTNSNAGNTGWLISFTVE